MKTTYLAGLGADAVDLVSRMESAASRMSVLIHDLLDYSRLTRPIDAFRPQHLNTLLAGVLAELELVVQEKRAIIGVNDLGTVPGEPTQLAQVFRNLITNALKFVVSGAPPNIVITRQTIARTDLPTAYQPIGNQETFCAIRVVDNGIGFDPRQAERIFGTFQRLHGIRHYPGAGIGLAIVKKVAENHGGYVLAESQPGAGSTFTLFLPV